jgi:hypothetical protein
MSWSIQYIGTPEKVIAALKANSEKLTGDSKAEFDAALPSMVELIGKNQGHEGQIIKVVGSGHAYAVGEELKSTLSFSIEPIHGVLI